MPDEWFDHGVAFALAALEEPDTKLLVHCHMGINRGPSLAYAVMLALGFDPVDAIDRIRRARPIAHADYAEDALDWWQRRSGTSETTAAAERRALREWRRNNKLDVVRIIREQREMGA
jgi:dual specificity phosphatase 3